MIYEIILQQHDSKNLGSFVQQEYSDTQKRKIVRKYAGNVTEIQNLRSCEKFRTESFNVIVDKLRIKLEKWSLTFNWTYFFNWRNRKQFASDKSSKYMEDYYSVQTSFFFSFIIYILQKKKINFYLILITLWSISFSPKIKKIYYL